MEQSNLKDNNISHMCPSDIKQVSVPSKAGTYRVDQASLKRINGKGSVWFLFPRCNPWRH
jgi:hypothetical protein